MSDADRNFWITVRAALIMFVRAIEKQYNLKEQEFEHIIQEKPEEIRLPVGYNVEVER